jgi:transposase
MASRRRDNRPESETRLYLGRLDGLGEREIEEKRRKMHALGDAALSLQFDALLINLGYPPPMPSLQDVEIARVRSYGPELALFRVAEDLSLTGMIDRRSAKGGGPSLGRMAFALAAYANLHHGSMLRFVKWYERSPLPIFLGLPHGQVTYDAALNTLDYLQPELTRELERELYSVILKRFNYRCERIDIDSSPVELAGELCRVIAKFGRSKNGGTGKRRQILITFMLDQKGVLLGHEVFPGSRNDAKTLTPVDRRLSAYGGAKNAKRVVDRGYASLKNVRAMKRRHEHFLVALKGKPSRIGLLRDIDTPRKEWEEMEKGVRAASVVREGLKWIVTWNDDVARRNSDGRNARIVKAREELDTLLESIAKGRVKSRSERDRKIGAIVRKHRVSKLISTKGKRKGVGFTYTVRDAGGDEGYQVYATTETSLSERDVVDAYRARDRVEKAIRTLKSCLGLGPVWVTRKEHVLGFVYIHALAYQLRSVMALRLGEAGIGMSAEEALWELEQLKAVELVVDGNEISVMRRLTTVKGEAERLTHIFSFASDEGYPGIGSAAQEQGI